MSSSAFFTFLAFFTFFPCVTWAADDLPAVRAHDNRQPAGVLTNGTLDLHLRAGVGLWRPEREAGPALEIEAFGEAGGQLSAPGPLIRVPEGSTLAVTIQNDLAHPLRVDGLCTHDGSPCAPVDVPAHGARQIQFAAGRAGTYAYSGHTTGGTLATRFGPGTQLSGAFIVDPPGAIDPDERIFVITEWSTLTRDQVLKAAATADPLFAVIAMQPQFTTLINGMSWPHTERLSYRVGERVRWRLINASPEPHPMHLHGFYFDVDSLGDGVHDTRFAGDRKKRVVTQLLPVGGTLAMTWTPERAGNWLFHCHIIEHVSSYRSLSRATDDAHGGHGAHDGHGNDDSAGMAGMVLGITVDEDTTTRASGSSGASDAPNEAPRDAAVVPARPLTLEMRAEPNRFGKEPGFGFVLIDPREPAADAVAGTAGASAVRAPGPTLVLRRGEPVAITLVNRLPEVTAVHWHGLELDSYYDGVHGFGGTGSQRTPLIAPGESFVVRFTPPRTGTFMYHTHMHDNRQLTAGLYGALLVVDPGETYDPATDHTLVIAAAGIGSPAPVVVNGSPKPQLAWRTGTRHRLRFANITRHNLVRVSLATVDGPVTWTPLTKDGAPVPAGDAAPRHAEQVIAVGETYDFAFAAPDTRQDVWIEVRDLEGRWLVQGRAVIK